MLIEAARVPRHPFCRIKHCWKVRNHPVHDMLPHRPHSLEHVTCSGCTGQRSPSSLRAPPARPPSHASSAAPLNSSICRFASPAQPHLWLGTALAPLQSAENAIGNDCRQPQGLRCLLEDVLRLSNSLLLDHLHDQQVLPRPFQLFGGPFRLELY